MKLLSILVLAAAIGCTDSGNNRIGNLELSANPQIALDGSGNGIAIWEQGANINVRYFDAETGFGDGELITDSRDNYHPEIAVAPDGTAIAVWLAESPDGSILVMVRRYQPVGGWESARILEAAAPATIDLPVAEFPDPDGPPRLKRGSALDPQQPQVGMDRDGNAIVTWARGGDIKAVRYSIATGWSEVLAVTNSAPLTHVRPQLAVHPDGDAMIVYARYGDPANIVIDGPTESYPAQPPLDVLEVCASPYSATLDSFLTPLLLDTGTKFGEYADPVVGVDPSGMFLMVWTRGGQPGGFPSMSSKLRYRGYRLGTGFLDDARDIFPEDFFDAYAPRIAMDGTGNAMLIYDSDRFAYESAMYLAATSRWVGAATATGPGAIGSRTRLGRVALAPDGTGYVTFGADQDEALVHGNLKLPFEIGLTGAMPIDNTLDSDASPRGDVAADASGIAVAVWQRNQAIQAHVWRAPVAAFTSNTPTAPALVELDGRSSEARSDNAEITAWEWTFADGGTQEGATITRALPAGTHDVTLKVTDTYGRTATTTRQVTVSPATGGGDDRFTLTIVFEGGGEGIVTMLGGEVRFDSREGDTFSIRLSPTTLGIDATAHPEFFFSHFTGCDDRDGSFCSILLNRDRTVRVSFE